MICSSVALHGCRRRSPSPPPPPPRPHHTEDLHTPVKTVAVVAEVAVGVVEADTRIPEREEGLERENEVERVFITPLVCVCVFVCHTKYLFISS